MKKTSLLLILFALLLCGCARTSGVSQAKYDEVLKEMNELQEDYDELLKEYASYRAEQKIKEIEKNTIYNTTAENNKETTIKNNEINKNEVYVELPKLPIQVSYVSSGKTKTTVQIDKITYSYKAYSDGTCRLTFYYTGSKIYGINNGDSSEPCYFDVILYDADEKPIERDVVSVGWINTGDVFTDKDDTIMTEVPLGKKYILALDNYN